MIVLTEIVLMKAETKSDDVTQISRECVIHCVITAIKCLNFKHVEM